jgi:hypothetical protein
MRRPTVLIPYVYVCCRHYPGRTDGTDALVPFGRRRPSPHYSWVSSCIISFEACSAFTRVTTCSVLYHQAAGQRHAVGRQSAMVSGFIIPRNHNPSLCAITYVVMFRIAQLIQTRDLNRAVEPITSGLQVSSRLARQDASWPDTDFVFPSVRQEATVPRGIHYLGDFRIR